MIDARSPRVRDYVDELDKALKGLPRERRVEIVRDIQSHIDAAVADLDEPTAAAIESILHGLGAPDDIAAAAYEEQPPVRGRIAMRDVAAVILLLVGGFVFFVGWIVGVVLLWSSTAWQTKDKVMATLLVPGGLLAPLLLAGSGLGSSVCEAANNGPEHCTSLGPTGAAALFGIVVLVVSVVGPFVTMAVLLRSARRS